MMMGLLAICQYAPFAIFGLFAGTIADRIDGRRLLFWAQMGLMICAAMLAR
jgi:MFS family permease